MDIDSTCVKVSQENIRMNEVEDLIEIRQGNLLDVVHEKAHIIVANIIAEVIIEMTDYVPDYLYDGGIFIASGIILEKVDRVRKKLEDKGFKILEIKYLGQWALIASALE